MEPDRPAVCDTQAEEAAASVRASAAVLRRAALVIGEFAALVAHETNQPIAAILLNCAAARNHLRDPNADLTRVQESIERIERDVKRAGAIIQRIRSLMTNTQPEYIPLDLNQLIEEALGFLEQELGQAGVVVTKALHPDLPLVFGDRVQLEQVLINLYSNAIEAMGSSSAGTRVLAVGTGFEGGLPSVSVRDTGPGVEPKALERLFEPLFTTKTGGIGLGLSISRSMVEAHGGRLWTTDGAASGACFRFTLHTAFEQAEADARPSGSPPSDAARERAGALERLSACDVMAAAVERRGGAQRATRMTTSDPSSWVVDDDVGVREAVEGLLGSVGMQGSASPRCRNSWTRNAPSDPPAWCWTSACPGRAALTCWMS